MGLVVYNVAWAETYFRAKWYLHPSSLFWPQKTWAENCGLRNYCAPFWGRGDGSPSNNLTWPGSRPTHLPSGILIHPAAWPQYINDIDRRATRQDRQTIQTTFR